MDRNERGLTLIEVLAAVVILTIVVLTFINFSSFSTLSTNKTDKKAGALRLAERTMNSLRDTVYTNATMMNINSLPTPTLPPDLVGSGYIITMSNSAVIANPSYSPALYPNKVSLQEIFILKNPSNISTTYLITIIVSWTG
jgi:prepilin-type N-terminal cleavage/methylation domain-containing protein